ncbi:uncharacterized protein [Palaemon carinicauda]|uniref:uncharacterized protein n=1 Tax=Palaemon carinicauda TaxID=392227 RepID=UPI0035B5AD86
MVARGIAEGEDLARDMIGGSSDDENSLDEVSVNPGLSLFEDHLRTGVIYTCPDRFNISAALKLVPVFDEGNVPEFFKAFERVATRFSWPTEMWTVLIHCRNMLTSRLIYIMHCNNIPKFISNLFIGTHCTHMAFLATSVARDYSKVKAYDLVPEAYRLKFSNSMRPDTMSYVEYAHLKEEQFDDWVKSCQVVSFSSLRELMLLEEFKKTCSKELRIHLEEIKAYSLSKAAQIADEFLLIHSVGSSSFSPSAFKSQSARPNNNWRSNNPIKTKVEASQGNNNGGRNTRVFSQGNQSSNNVGRARRTCFLCHEQGHFQARCPAWMSLVIDSKVVRVNFLRDTGSARSLVLSRVLKDVGENSGNYVVLGGFPDTVVSAPLVEVGAFFPGYHKVTELAVVEKLPILGIDGILGNDMLDAQGGTDDLTKPRGLLYRVSRPVDHGLNQTSRVEQIVIPSKYQNDVLSLAHEDSFSGHFGVCKTHSRLAKYFWWPGLKSSVKKFVGSCETCQIMGKPNKPIPKAPLHPIPAIGDPFAELVVDVVGPLPRTKSGFTYLLTIMDRAFRFPEAFPMRKITSKVVFEKLIEFFSRYGLPHKIQTDCGTNFTSKVFKGIAPFELIFGHKVRGPLEIFHELLEVSHKKELNVGKFVEDLRRRLSAAWKFAQDNLVLSQASMKKNYNKKSKARSFEPGELVLVLITDSDNLLEPRYKGPWKVLRQLSDVNYEVEAPGTKRKCRIFHINRLKSYTVGTLDPLAIVYEPASLVLDHTLEEPADLFCQVSSDALTSNVQNLETLVKGLGHLEGIQKNDMMKLISYFSDLFQASPGRTTLLQHDVDVGSASPVKQSPYRLNPEKRDIVEETKYMLEHDLIRPSVSPWSSPIVLVKKPDWQFRMCVDYRKVNANTKNDSFPLPCIEDCLDQIGPAKFITKLDLLKGYIKLSVLG